MAKERFMVDRDVKLVDRFLRTRPGCSQKVAFKEDNGRILQEQTCSWLVALRGCDEINGSHKTTAAFSKARADLGYSTTTVVNRDCMITCKDDRQYCLTDKTYKFPPVGHHQMLYTEKRKKHTTEINVNLEEDVQGQKRIKYTNKCFVKM
jgi:hypothetical protein